MGTLFRSRLTGTVQHPVELHRHFFPFSIYSVAIPIQDHSGVFMAAVSLNSLDIPGNQELQRHAQMPHRMGD